VRWRSWLINILVFLLILTLVQWWKGRALATGEAPPLAGLALDGQAVDLADARGQPVLVYFWATWCPACRLTSGAIDDIARDHRVVGVALQSGEPWEIERFMRERGQSFRVLADPDGQLASRWGVQGVPSVFVIDGAGRIRHSTVGVSTGLGLRVRLWLAGTGR
jgi:peroxiredoxin